jgi:hypothetical protein
MAEAGSYCRQVAYWARPVELETPLRHHKFITATADLTVAALDRRDQSRPHDVRELLPSVQFTTHESPGLADAVAPFLGRAERGRCFGMNGRMLNPSMKMPPRSARGGAAFLQDWF